MAKTPPKPKKQKGQIFNATANINSYLSKKHPSLTDKPVPIESIPTGCLLLDSILPYGGLPFGSVAELYGPPSVGKTSIAIQSCASAAKYFKTHKIESQILYLNSEAPIDRIYAKSMGVDFDGPMFKLIDVSSIEQTRDILKNTIAGFRYVVIDSPASLMPEKELEELDEYKTEHLRSQKLTSFFRHVEQLAKNYRVAVLCPNQNRSKGDRNGGFHEDSAGPKHQKHGAALRIALAIGAQITEGEDKVLTHLKTTATITKNKYGPRNQAVKFYLKNSGGYDNYLSAIEHAIEDAKLIQKQGDSDKFVLTRGLAKASSEPLSRKELLSLFEKPEHSADREILESRFALNLKMPAKAGKGIAP